MINSMPSFRVAALLSSLVSSVAYAQASAVHRTTMEEQAIPGSAYNAVTMKIIVDMGGKTMPHSHPGVEMGYIAAGEATLILDGKAPQIIPADTSFIVPANLVHHVENSGSGDLLVISTYIVENSKPVVIPAP
jgi:quercetin dioxygenase-like cupin family protein